QQSTSACLTSDCGLRGEIIRPAINAGRRHATVIVANENAAFLVHPCVHEIEQVAAGTAAADSTTLSWIARRDVLRNPSLAAIISDGDVEIPDAGKIWSVIARVTRAAVPVIASGLRPEVSDGGAGWVAGD